MTRPRNPWAKAFADFTHIYEQITGPETPIMQSTISTLAAQLVADIAAVDADTHNRYSTDAEIDTACAALIDREFAILRMPSQSARDLAIKIQLAGREYLEGEGTLAAEIIREVDALITSGPDADLIAPTATNHRHPDIVRAGTGLSSELVT